MKQIGKYIFLLTVGGLIYNICEIIYRGYTFGSMFIVGGICFVVAGLVNEFMEWETTVYIQMLIAAVMITIIEFIAGMILNVWLDLEVWNYSQLWGNICGQVCPQFFAVWYILSLPAITLDDFIRWKIFHEEKPRYYWTFARNNFECRRVNENGICKRYVALCDTKECRMKYQCGECENYMIPYSQKPCKNCEVQRKKKG